MANPCEMIVGFLVPHRCENPALGRCARCNRAYCEEHVQVTPGGLQCVACEQGLDTPVSLPLTAQTYSPADIHTFSSLSRLDADDSPDDVSDSFSDLS